MKRYLLLIIFLITLIIPSNIYAKEVKAYLFYGKGCPHCAELEKYLDKEYKNDKDLTIYRYEVWNNEDNVKLWNKVQENLCVESKGVPYFVVGNKVLRGYNKGPSFENKVDTLIRNAKGHDYKDIAGITLGTVKGSLDKNECKNLEKEEQKTQSHKLDVPLIGTIDLEMLSIPVIAVIIGLVDGFNPCAMWVLIFIITLLLNYSDRKKMWILGLTFILTSGLIYFLFMLGVVQISNYTTQINWLKYLIGTLALGLGIYNIYRYVESKKKGEDGCDVTSKEDRKKIMLRAKKAVENDTFILAIIGIILLAVTVNFIELLCSLGLPVVYTEILSYNNITGIKSIFYLILYIIFFLLDDIIVFVIAMKTLKIKVVSNKYTKYSHLIGGLIMTIIGLLMLFKPEWLMFNF